MGCKSGKGGKNEREREGRQRGEKNRSESEMREWSESVVSEWGGDRGVRWWSEGVGWVERVGWGVRVGRKRDSGERERVIRDRRIEACKSGVRDWGWLKGCDSRVGCENGERERERDREGRDWRKREIVG